MHGNSCQSVCLSVMTSSVSTKLEVGANRYMDPVFLLLCLPKLSIITKFLFCVKNPFQDGCSPLFVASLKGHTDVVDLLVKEGADVNLTTTEVIE